MAKKDETPESRVQQQVDEETEQGYFGVSPDPTPNEAYTVQGVTRGDPTPETDAKLAAKARQALRGY